MNKKLIILLLSTAVFVCLVGYNYLVAQKKIKDTRSSPLGISLQSFPQSVELGQSGSFLWEVDSSPDLSTPKTTIYWGYDSSPSALTKTDSPEAVGYPYQTEDYASGIFKLPDSFDLNIKFIKYHKSYLNFLPNQLYPE